MPRRFCHVILTIFGFAEPSWRIALACLLVTGGACSLRRRCFAERGRRLWLAAVRLLDHRRILLRALIHELTAVVDLLEPGRLLREPSTMA
jgi:hypothetical protein